MGAVYPSSVRAFDTKIDLTMTVFALHMNDAQDEITAIQNALGTNPQGAATGPATVGKRLADLETGKAAFTHDHANRLDDALHDIAARHVFGGALGSPELPQAIVFGGGGSIGDGDNPANERHIHPAPSAGALSSAVIPSGTMVAYGGTSTPSGWAMCDGASYLRGTSAADTYYNLFQAIGVAYGAADGTHFNVPNLRSRFPMGRATAGATVVTAGSRDAVLVSHAHPGSGVSNGNADHSHYVDHTHGTGDSGDHSHSMYPGWGGGSDITLVSIGGPQNYRLANFGEANGPFVWFGHTFGPGNHNHGNTSAMNGRTGTDGASGAANHGHGLTIANQGSSATDANLPPYQTVNWIIKV